MELLVASSLMYQHSPKARVSISTPHPSPATLLKAQLLSLLCCSFNFKTSSLEYYPFVSITKNLFQLFNATIPPPLIQTTILEDFEKKQMNQLINALN